MKRDRELLSYLFTNPDKILLRKEYFKGDFLSFCLYYFPNEFTHPLAPFHKEYLSDLQVMKNVFFVWFRECAKTMFLTYYYIYCIVYQKRRYIMHYNSEIDQAKSILLDLIVILQTNDLIIHDFWYLYIPPEWRKQNEPTKKTIWEFMIDWNIKVQAMSIWKSPRWKKFLWRDGRTHRPDLVWFDDIDTNKNTKNPTLIEADIRFLTWEVFGGLNSFAQKIFLWNVINEDGRIPRLRKFFEKNKDFKIFWIPIRIKWNISWSRFVSTDKEAEEKNKGISDDAYKFISLQTKRRDWLIAYNQNFNLISYKNGQNIIKKSDIRYFYKLPINYKIVFWIDPAFSEKTWTDAMWLTITAQEKFNWDIFKYILESIWFEWIDKDEDKFCNTVVELYNKYKCSLIYIEWNNWGLILARMLRKRWLAVIVVNSEKDKVTRLREFQWEFERWLIKFNSDGKKVWSLEEQLLAFPWGEHDDMVDSMVFSFTPYAWWEIRAF